MILVFLISLLRIVNLKLINIRKNCLIYKDSIFYKDENSQENEQDKLLKKEILHIEKYLIYLDDCSNFPSLLKKRNRLLDNFKKLNEKLSDLSNLPDKDSALYKQLKLEFDTTDFALKKFE